MHGHYDGRSRFRQVVYEVETMQVNNVDCKPCERPLDGGSLVDTRERMHIFIQAEAGCFNRQQGSSTLRASLSNHKRAMACSRQAFVQHGENLLRSARRALADGC